MIGSRYLGAVQIVSMCGSLGPMSANSAALEVAAERVRAGGHSRLVPAIDVEPIPMFSPALDGDSPRPVVELRALLEGADGVMLAAPEYAGGLAGGIKNALDWLVGSASIYRTPVVVLSAGTTGGEFAIDQLVRTLSWQGALVVSTLGISAPRTKTDDRGRFVDRPTIEAIELWADDLVAACSMSRDRLLQRVTAVVTPFGIDASRFGDLR